MHFCAVSGSIPSRQSNGGFFSLLIPHRLPIVNYKHRREGRGIGGVAVFVREAKPPADKAHFRFVVNEFVKIACVCPHRKKKHDRRSGLRLFVSLPNPFADFPPIRWIAKYCPPPPATFQEDLSPSVSGVKYSGHFAVLSVAAASSVKQNSSFSLSKKSCGVHQSIFFEDRSALFTAASLLSGNRFCFPVCERF